MTDRIYIYETCTGKFVREITAATAYSWTSGINDSEGSVTVETVGSAAPADECIPWRHTLAVVNDVTGTLAAGPLYKRDYDFSTGRLTLTAGSMWTLLKRVVWQKNGRPILADNTHYKIAADGSRTDWRTTYRAGSAGGLVLAIVKDQLPSLAGIDRISPDTGNAKQTTVDGLSLSYLADVIKPLFDDSEVPLVRFEGNAATFGLFWSVDVLGEQLEPQTHVFNLDATGGALTSAKITEDYGSACNRAWLASRIPDDSVNQMFAMAAKPLEAGDYRLDYVSTQYDNVAAGTLDSYASTFANSAPFEQISLTVTHDSMPRDGASSQYEGIKAGDWVIITTEGGFYGTGWNGRANTVAWGGRVQTVGGNDKELTVNVERVTRTIGRVPYEPVQPVVAMPARTAPERIKALEEYQRRANNPLL